MTDWGINFVDGETDFVVREIPEPDSRGRSVVQIVDIRCTGATIEWRAYFLRHNGKRWSQNKDLFALEREFPGVLRLITSVVFAVPEGAPKADNVTYFLEYKRKHRPNNPPPAPFGGGETAPRKRAACG